MRINKIWQQRLWLGSFEKLTWENQQLVPQQLLLFPGPPWPSVVVPIRVPQLWANSEPPDCEKYVTKIYQKYIFIETKIKRFASRKKKIYQSSQENKMSAKIILKVLICRETNQTAPNGFHIPVFSEKLNLFQNYNLTIKYNCSLII